VRAGREAARLQYVSAELEAEYARQSIAALVAKSWFLATEARLQKGVAEDMVRASQQLVNLARERQRIGSGNEYDTVVAQASLQTQLDVVQHFDLAYRQSVRALEALAGRYPAAALDVPARLPAKPGRCRRNASELLERRLDVVTANARVAAALYRTEEAKAARLPKISLTAAVSSISSDLFVLKTGTTPCGAPERRCSRRSISEARWQSQVEIRTAEQKLALANSAAWERGRSARSRRALSPASRSTSARRYSPAPSRKTSAR